MRLVLIGCLFSLNLMAQQPRSRPFILPFVNQFTAAIIPSSDAELHGRLGYGIGIARVVKPDNNMNLVVGLEYNRNFQYMASYPVDLSPKRSNVKYDISTVSVPVLFRGSVGFRDRAFSEFGGYVEAVGGSSSGQVMTTDADGNSSWKDFQSDLNKKVNVGGSVGAGALISWSRIQMLFKAEARFGIRNVSDNGKLYNRFVRFSMGILLPQNKKNLKKQEDWDKANAR